MKEFPILETNRLLLRPITMDDKATLYEIFKDEEMMIYYGMYPLKDMKAITKLIKNFNKGFEEDRSIRWAIELKEEHKLIGTCGFHNMNKHHRRSEIGYEIHKDYWRKGYVTEAVEEMMSYGMEEMSLNRIEALIYPENIPSQKLLEKLGFTKEGLLKDYYIFRNLPQDLLMYSYIKKVRRNVQVYLYDVLSHQVLMLKRTPERSGYWQPVCGGIKKGESLYDAAIREVTEETGIIEYESLQVLPLQFSYKETKNGEMMDMEDLCMVMTIKGSLEVVLSEEHNDYTWCHINDVHKLSEWIPIRKSFNHMKKLFYYEIMPLTKSLIKDEMLDDFIRKQVVTKRFELKDGKKILKPTDFVDDWSLEKKRNIVNNYFRNTDYYSEGIFENGRLIGFYSFDKRAIGPNNEYLLLSMLHVSKDYRGQGLGELLYHHAVSKARITGAKKFYISTHSSYESQKFYEKVGCVMAEWLYDKAVKEEPFDIQLEYEFILD